MIADLARSASDEQTLAIEHDGGNAYVNAGPGTGKTFLLVERYGYLRDRGVASSKILVLTFSKRAVLELRERLVAVGFSEREIEVRTFHGFAARAIGGGTAIARSGRLLDGLSRELVLDTVIAKTPTPAIAEATRTSRPFRSEIARLLDDLNRAPLPETELASHASGRLKDVLAIARQSVSERARIGATDIGDLIARAVSDARKPNSLAAKFLNGRYAHVLVDEFQDTDRGQLDLLAALGAQIFAVGDEAQSIYRFRGASNAIVADAVLRFQMKRFGLSVSLRCPPDVCALASQTPLPDLAILTSARHSGELVDVVRLRGTEDEVAYLANAIESEIDAGRPAHEIAVLLRTFRPIGPLLIAELRRRSIAIASTGREGLLADPRIVTLRLALQLMLRPTDVHAWQQFLASPSLGLDPIAVRLAGADLSELDFDDSLAAKLDRVAMGSTLPSARLAAALIHARTAWDADDLGNVARCLVRELGLIAAVIRDEAPNDVHAASSRLALVCDALAGLQQTALALNEPSRCSDLVPRFEEDLPALALDDAGLDAKAPGVRVLTIHGAKGLEFERVFVADAVAGRFPHDERTSSLLTDADRDVLVRAGVDGPSVVTGGAMLEEASLWYVALTRASERLTVTFGSASLDGQAQRPSRFIPVDRLPRETTLVERRSLYSRVARFGTEHERDAMLASTALDPTPALADFARLGESAFDPVADTPIAGRMPLSVSNVETWLRCPRQLFYQRFAGIRSETNATMTLGTAIHSILEAFHAAEIDFGPTTVAVDSWTTELLRLRADHWANVSFESDALSLAAGNAADAALRSYARALGERATSSTFTVEYREVERSIAVGAYELRGKVDRVDRMADGTREVLDYKTGSARAASLGVAAAKIVKEWVAADESGEPRLSLARRLTKDQQLQLALYATAFENIAATAYVFMAGRKKMELRNGAIFERSQFAGDLVEVTMTALREIEHDLLAPITHGTLMSMPTTFDETNCTFCDFHRICPGPEV